MTPEKLRKKRILREKRRKNRLNKNKIRDEFLNKEALRKEKIRLEEKAKYDSISLEDFEKSIFDFFKENFKGNPDLVDSPDKTSKKMEKFYDEFSKRGNFKKHTSKGYFHSYIHENGYVLLSNKPTVEEINSKLLERYEGNKNLTETEEFQLIKHFQLGIDGSYFNIDNRIKLELIVSDVDNRGKGWGTKMMNVLIELTKKYDYSISLISAGNDMNFTFYITDKLGAFKKFLKNSPLTTYKLISWYKSFGFDIDPRQAGVYRFHSRSKIEAGKKLTRTMKNTIVEEVEPNLLHPSSSVEENLKFPSLKGYDGWGFDYSSTSKCFNNWILK